MKRKIVGIGETVLDLVFKNDRPIAAVPGGSTFNALISLGRTIGVRQPEIPIIMVTETGDDHIGDIVTSFMRRNNVSDEAVTRNPGTQTHVSMAFLDEKNDAQYEFYKNHAAAKLTPSKCADMEFGPSDIVLFGSFFAINPVIREYVVSILKAARKAGAVIYYDVNFRKSHCGELAQTLGYIEENMSLSTFVRASNEDIFYVFGTSEAEKAYEKIKTLCPNYICTHGPGPIEVFSPGIHKFFSTPAVRTVSTIGAGDNFNAGFLYGLSTFKMKSGSGLQGSALVSGLTEDSRLSIADWETLTDCAKKFSSNVCCSIFNYVDEDFVKSL